MSDLLDLAIAAHDGWDHWQQQSKLTASASVGGVLWAVKGKDGIVDNLVAEVDCHEQHVVFISPELRSIYTPSRTAIETDEEIDKKVEDLSFAEAREGLKKEWEKDDNNPPPAP
jgi:hypothetical protein